MFDFVFIFHPNMSSATGSTVSRSKTDSLDFTLEVRKVEESLMEAAMLFNPVDYAAQYHVPLKHLKDVLTVNTLANTHLVDVVNQLAADCGTILAWSTPHCTLVATPTRPGTTWHDANRVYFTKSSSAPMEIKKLTWGNIMWSDYSRQLAKFGTKEIVVDDVSSLAPFGWHVSAASGKAWQMQNAVLDRIFIVILDPSLYSTAEISALAGFSLGCQRTDKAMLFSFSMLKYYMDHWLLHDSKDQSFFDLSTMSMLSEANREALFARKELDSEQRHVVDDIKSTLSAKIDRLKSLAEEDVDHGETSALSGSTLDDLEQKFPSSLSFLADPVEDDDIAQAEMSP